MKNRIFLLLILIFLLTACVDQNQKRSESNNDLRIIATSMSTVDIMERLNVDLVAIPESQIGNLPKRYRDLPRIGMAMTPDLEKLTALKPDYVFSPVSLISDLLPKYEATNLNYGFLNLNNIEGMYKTIKDLGKLLSKENEAESLIKEYKENIQNFKQKYKDRERPKVLILMGLPGSYVVATENSYVGDLVKLAGGKNIYDESDQQFINVNTEDMLEKNPDIILRTSHAMPEEVHEMFEKDFKTNDIWKHFKAVEGNKVFDLSNDKFGMSAKFNYMEALDELGEIFYEKEN